MQPRHKLTVAAIALAGIGVLAWPYVFPSSYLPTVERTAAPLVAALRLYTAEHGLPPVELRELVPAYLDALPETGYPPCPTFGYARGPREHWSLDVDGSFGPAFSRRKFELFSTAEHWRYVPARDDW